MDFYYFIIYINIISYIDFNCWFVFYMLNSKKKH